MIWCIPLKTIVCQSFTSTWLKYEIFFIIIFYFALAEWKSAITHERVSHFYAPLGAMLEAFLWKNGVEN